MDKTERECIFIFFQEQENKLLSITATLKSSKKEEKKEKSPSHVRESIVHT